VSLVGHVTPEVAPRTDLLAFDVSFVPRMYCRVEDRAFGVHLPDCIAPIALLTINFRICESGLGNGG
jgi:hypothetical protein